MAFFSSSLLRKHDVFLSFRGQDTRRHFVSHLYKELMRKGIQTLKDDCDAHPKGTSIFPDILQAIRDSKFAVIVFSQNYVSSNWCLDELVEIIKCQEKGSLKIFPVFYEVDPSDVRRQKGPFAEFLQKHEENPEVSPETVQQWKKALIKVTDMAVMYSRSWSDDSYLIEEIVDEISMGLFNTASSYFNYNNIVGMEHHMEALSALLDLDSINEVRMIGIWGIPGVGKTTLARYVFGAISQHFQTHYFLEDVKKFFSKSGSGFLQELLSTYPWGALTRRRWQAGFDLFKAALGHQKVLIVIDDVDEMEQLNVLAKYTSWFGPGSRIIITTRDKHLLLAHGIEYAYEVQCLIDETALQLFSLSAFGLKKSSLDFLPLSIQAVHYAGRLPFELKRLGLSLHGRSKKEWEMVLEGYVSLHYGRAKILNVQYDGLNEMEKFIFLRVACLFDGFHFELVSRILGDDHEEIETGIQLLARKSFINISHGNITVPIVMQKLGRELVRRQLESTKNCRLLVDSYKMYKTLTHYKVTGKIEGIFFDMSKTNLLSAISDEFFERINNLVLLKFYNRRSDNDEVNLPTSVSLGDCMLRYLEWDAYPLRNIQFRPEYLVALTMRESKLEKLWEGSRHLPNLREIEVSCSRNLKALPDLSSAPNLQVIRAAHCGSLKEISWPISGLNKLNLLDIRFCISLERLPTLPPRIGTLLGRGCPAWEATSPRIRPTIEFSGKQLDHMDEVSSRRGLDISCEALHNWVDDPMLIDEFNANVSKQTITTVSSDLCGLVGIDFHMEALRWLLDLKSENEVRTIGICGVGGVGKTTLARYMYEQISQQFQTFCFVENTRKTCQVNGTSGLQEDLSKNLQTVWSSSVGSQDIKAKPGHQKVLLVADDVDKVAQLDLVAEYADRFDSGSRIIVTTRNKDLLPAHGIKYVYEVECLEYSQALQLFSQYAFKQNHPCIGFEQLSDRAVRLAGGLPLALRVLGSNLHGRSEDDWESTLRRLEASTSDSEGLVAMDRHMKVMYRLLDLNSKIEVRVIGIWGMGGVGKTTLARHVYEKISPHFQTHFFLKNVEKNGQDHGQLGLQEEILSKCLRGEALKTSSSTVDADAIKARLGNQKTLLVADGIDNVVQLNAVVNGTNWFGPGSVVIITTKDKSLLVNYNVKHVYEVECLRYDEALQLFSQFAFKQIYPPSGFEELSVRAIQLAGFLPLGLKVFGSFLHGKCEEDWEQALHRVEASLDEETLEILKMGTKDLLQRYSRRTENQI